MQDAVGIDQKFHFHARNARRHWRNTLQVETRKRAAILREFALTLQNVDRDVRLPIDLSRVELRRGGRDGRIPQNNFVGHAPGHFNAERKRSHVEQQHILGGLRAAAENVRLYRRPQSDHFIGIQVRMGLAPEHFFHQRANFWNARRTTDQHDFVDLFRLEIRIFQRLLAGADGAVDDGVNELLKLRPRNLALVALAVRQFNIEFDRRLRGERDFGVDYGLTNGLYGFGVAAEIETEIAVNIIERDRDQQIVNVVAAEMGITIGGHDFEDAVVQFENRNIERSATQIVDRDDPVLLLVQTIGERCRRRFIDQTQHFEPGNAASIFCGLALRIVEVCGNGNDSFRNRLTEVALGIPFELAQNERGDFRRSIRLFAQLNTQDLPWLQIFRQTKRKQIQLFLNVFHAASHEALNGVDSSLRSLDKISASSIPDDGLIVRVERNYRRH